jgi:endogenous inhibitor of DNA gyrase (YacG/DUF329 family)
MNAMNTKKPPPSNRVVCCPRCRKSTRYDVSNPFRPFCSALCKNEDIISWVEQSYRIAGEAVQDPDELPEQAPEPAED